MEGKALHFAFQEGECGQGRGPRHEAHPGAVFSEQHQQQNQSGHDGDGIKAEGKLIVPGYARAFGEGREKMVGTRQTLAEPQLEERLKALRIDIANIAKVVATTTGRTLPQVEEGP